MPRFSHLKRGSDERRRFWDEHHHNILSFLEEFNEDIFEGKGSIKEHEDFPIPGSISFGPDFTSPNLVLPADIIEILTRKWAIGICTDSPSSLYILCSREFGSRYPLTRKFTKVKPQELVSTLEKAALWFIQGD